MDSNGGPVENEAAACEVGNAASNMTLLPSPADNTASQLAVYDASLPRERSKKNCDDSTFREMSPLSGQPGFIGRFRLELEWGCESVAWRAVSLD